MKQSGLKNNLSCGEKIWIWIWGWECMMLLLMMLTGICVKSELSYVSEKRVDLSLPFILQHHSAPSVPHRLHLGVPTCLIFPSITVVRLVGEVDYPDEMSGGGGSLAGVERWDDGGRGSKQIGWIRKEFLLSRRDRAKVREKRKSSCRETF